MKKRIGCLALLMILCMSAAPAFAVTASGHLPESMAFTVGAYTVYIGEGNALYRSDMDGALTEGGATGIVYADASMILYTTTDTAHTASGKSYGHLMRLDIGTGEAALLADIVSHAVYCLSDALIYYVPQSDAMSVCAYAPYNGEKSTAITLTSAVTDLRDSVDGLQITTKDKKINRYVRATSSLSTDEIAQESYSIENFGAYETFLTAKHNLYLRGKGMGSKASTAIAANVTAAASMDGVTYYIQKDGGHSTLYSYAPSEKKSHKLAVYKTALLPQITAFGGYVYLTGADGTIYRYSVESHSSDKAGALSATIDSPMLIATQHGLLVYDLAGGGESASFADMIPLKELDEMLSGIPERTEPPAEITLLTQGSRGEAVLALQETLARQGYLGYDGVDGIFGRDTKTAVRYMQFDLGLADTGKADADFLALIASRPLPTYDKCAPLQRGDRGIRVSVLQQRLYNKHYFADTVDGVYGSRTEHAVKLLQAAYHLPQTGDADAETLEILYGADCKNGTVYPEQDPYKYISREQGDELCKWIEEGLQHDKVTLKQGVRILQKRLVELNYLDRVTGVYDKSTYKAVMTFQLDRNLDRTDGAPGSETMIALFGTLVRGML